MEPAEELREDPLRTQLLDAAARVFAAKGYSGTKIADIVREAGLSTGAVYGRFRSKDELLREAVIGQAMRHSHLGAPKGWRVAELIQRLAALSDAPLTDAEAVRLEAFVTARREPDVAAAVHEAQQQWRAVVQPLVDAAQADGTVADDVDPEAVLYFVRTLALGLLVQRGAGIPKPDPVAWDTLVTRIVESFGKKEQP
ncbi:MAG TPA: TetR/AcrR family transcriptional regulator [Acidimicrobiales bacterium]|nr:TetR/AcrR family transcriptional regulator [Acidimicrobiales bacterium]